MAGVKASGLLGFNATSFLLLHLGIFLHSSLQILSGPVRLDQTMRGHFKVLTKMVDWDQVGFPAGPLQSFHRVGVAQFDLTLGHLGRNNKIGIMSNYMNFSQSSCGNISETVKRNRSPRIQVSWQTLNTDAK